MTKRVTAATTGNVMGSRNSLKKKRQMTKQHLPKSPPKTEETSPKHSKTIDYFINCIIAVIILTIFPITALINHQSSADAACSVEL